MKLKFNVTDKNQPAPFVFQDGEKFYLYVTAKQGVEAYEADDPFGVWVYKGIVTDFKCGINFWAPSVIKKDGVYYMYVSCLIDDRCQFMHVAKSLSPLGPFKNEKKLYDEFSIDSHVIETKDGLFLFYSKNRTDSDHPGTRIFVDKLLDPYTVENKPKEVVSPSFNEEIFAPNRVDGKPWYTIEGAFWFQEGEWQYVMYSGGCFKNDTYHIGYVRAKTTESDLKKVTFEKFAPNGKFCPVIIKNEFEEGTGHHSVLKFNGEYFAVYHARDYDAKTTIENTERRTARICRLRVEDGVIIAERHPKRL